MTFSTTVEMEEILPELILNWDQTGIRLVPSSSWTMEQRGAKRVEMVGQNDKREIAAVFCGSLQGDFLPVQVIYKEELQDVIQILSFDLDGMSHIPQTTC